MTNATLDRETWAAESEPLTPELVLVDPQLAVVARARLAAAAVDEPPRMEESEVRPSATDPAPAERPSAGLPAAVLEQAVDEATRPSAGSPTRLRSAFGAAVVVLVVVVLSSGLTLLLPRLLDEPSGTVESVGRTPPAGAPGRSNIERTGAPVRTTPEGAPPTQTPTRHVFAWVPAARATHYKVEFFRRGAKVFEAFPASARIALPARWDYGGRRFELAPGSYRWSVRPGYGSRGEGRYGRIIVRSTWVYPSGTTG